MVSSQGITTSPPRSSKQQQQPSTMLSPTLPTSPDSTVEGTPRRPVPPSPRNNRNHRDEHTPTSASHRGSINAAGGFFFNYRGGNGSSTGRASTSASPIGLMGARYGRDSNISSRQRGGSSTTPNRGSSSLHLNSGYNSPTPYFPSPTGGGRSHREHRGRNHHHGSGRHAALGGYGGGPKGGSLVPSPPPASLAFINSVAGDQLLFSETNMDWTKLNIFRTRLCDRLTQTHTCHMANRCLFSHDVTWPRRTPFLPRATALTLRYIPVWCPRLCWPPLVGLCDSSGKVSWTSTDESWNARFCHQKCTRGDNCPFVHNVEEFLYHPEVYKTRSCCLANDDNFDEEMDSHPVALCPWYFCPFAHDVYELRNLREAKYAWHAPPQIVDDDHVARTQDFDELERRIIEFVRRSPNGSLDLYASPDSPLARHWRERMPPVIRPIVGSSLEGLKRSPGHRTSRFDDLMHLMVVASFLNLLLYPVENFYIPTLLSLQCAVLQSQMGYVGQELTCAELITRFHQYIEDGGNDNGKKEIEYRRPVPSADWSGGQSPRIKLTDTSTDHILFPPDNPSPSNARRTGSNSPSRHDHTPYRGFGDVFENVGFRPGAQQESSVGGGGSSSQRLVGGGESSPTSGEGVFSPSNQSGGTPRSLEEAVGAGEVAARAEEIEALFELLKPEELLQVVALWSASQQQDNNSIEATAPPTPL